jgi:ribonuclease HI
MWKETNDGLYKKFELDNFTDTIKFINKVLQLAQENNHHPKLISSYTDVEVFLKTHDSDSVTKKDHELASKIDNSFSQKQIKNTSINDAKLFTDGGSRGNPGPSAIGFAVLDSDDLVIKEYGEYIGETTNNQAEYKALSFGLDSCIELGIKNLEVYMDSQLIVNQINGSYKVKNTDLIPIYNEIKSKLKSFSSISFAHVPREQNKLADSLVNKALDDRIN